MFPIRYWNITRVTVAASVDSGGASGYRSIFISLKLLKSL